MKRYLALLLSLICVLSVALSGCGVDPSLQSGKKEPTVTTDDPVLDDQPEGTEELDERIVPYREAIKQLKEGNINEAYDLFLTIKDYKDVSAYLECFAFRYSSFTIISPDYASNTYYEYNELGNATFKQSVIHTDDMSRCTYEYDEDGRVILETYNYGDNETQYVKYEYGEDGSWMTVTNSEGLVEKTEYDETGEIIKITTYDGRTLTYSVSEDGRIKKTVSTSKDGKQLFEETEEYDERGNLIKSTTKHLGGENVTTNTYDENGNLLVNHYLRFDGHIRTIKNEYDENGNRIISQNISNLGEPTVSIFFKYDENGNVTETRRLTDHKVTSTRYCEYDSRGYCVKDTYIYESGDTNTVTFEYDDYGNVLKETRVYTGGPYETTDVYVYLGYKLYYNPNGMGDTTPIWIDGKG